MLSVETAPFPSTSALLAPFPYKTCSCVGTPTCEQIADVFPGIHFSCDALQKQTDAPRAGNAQSNSVCDENTI